ncbi:ubiquitin-conjugating enzyme E2 J2-like [Haliotis rubra]|uniref:ubiquitin-conjugating enzyme E2 J2-like n=1 Tax=Haliotis rubra TaxID=36100 RepID=UPI001EE532D8|nr:ubiquitin-conjugating enzyme E2 J2-like [Haliotis rubra]
MSSGKRVNTTATARLKQDYMRIMKDPVPYVKAVPLPTNMLEWHYVVQGPENSPYEGGLYHGKLIFPREFPFKPPSIYMITPNGRFKCNTRLCLSISDFHPDTWNPAWSVSTILTGLLSFMLEKSPTLGSIETSDYTKRQLAAQSGTFNLGDKVFCELFSDIAENIRAEIRRREEEMQRSTDSSGNIDGGSRNGRSGLLNGNPNTVLNGQNQGFFGTALTNIFVIIGFAAFAYTVKYVLRSVVD